MDPIANLDEQRRIATLLLDGCDEQESHELSMRLAELVLALDEWMTKGGFSPWRKGT